MTTFFCPVCWAELPDERASCPVCGADLNAAEAEPYDARLMRALDHPIREPRMMAIQLLGRRRVADAVSPLERLLEDPTDFVQARSVLHALAEIDTAEAWSAIERARRSTSALVRSLAEELVASR